MLYPPVITQQFIIFWHEQTCSFLEAMFQHCPLWEMKEMDYEIRKTDMKLLLECSLNL